MNAMDECNVAMDDCMAAMVLMSLSCSPKSPLFSGDRTADFSSFAVDSMFQCTWPGCGEIRNHCEAIERHVRVEHLGRSADSLDDECSDHEEEFYYNEIEVFPQHSSSASSASSQGFLPSSLPHKFETVPNVADSGASSSSSLISPTQSPGPLVESDSVPFFASSSAPTWSHLDMVRPPHEDPEYRKFITAYKLDSEGEYGKYIVKKVEPLHRNIAGNEAHLSNGTGKASMATHPINIPGSGGGAALQAHYARPLNLCSSLSSSSLSKASTASSHNHNLHNHNNNYHNHLNAVNKYHSRHHHYHHNSGLGNGSGKCGTTLLQSPSKMSALSPTRRTRGETKKCRKMYGMDNRESWCTQCKWKKACSRFVD